MESMGLDGDVSKDDYLELMTGEKLKNLSELIGALETMSDDTFAQHVSKNNNDFADWIADAYEEIGLSKQVGKIRKSGKMRKFLEKVLEKEKAKKVQKIILPRKKKDILRKLGEMVNEM